MKRKLSGRSTKKKTKIYIKYIQNEMKCVQNIYKIYVKRTGRKFVRKMSADASLIPEFS